ncbi:MAG: L,D-transpeptidase family protein [Desulfobacterales bacterium]
MAGSQGPSTSLHFHRSMERSKLAGDQGQKAAGGFLRFIAVGVLIISMSTGGCSHTDKENQARLLSREASRFFNQGNYEAALGRYEQIFDILPLPTDRVLFETGILYAYPENNNKDYQKSLECFQKLAREYPDSEYRHDSQMMILQIRNVIIKDKIIASQQEKLESSRRELESKASEIDKLKERVAWLEAQNFELRTEPADKVLIEKEVRRLTLLSKGEVIKTYKIALGGNPVGPKEREGDNKTPEGTYIIDSRNGNSNYHLSLHISYPNEKDKMRARELGVSPGGDIMIHGIKDTFSKMGAFHSDIDWTEGCIAVTNQEMEEIYKFVPDGTIVEIRP